MMKQRRTTVYKTEKAPLKRVRGKQNTCFSSSIAACTFAVACAAAWVLSLLQIACGSLREVFRAKSFGEVLNLFLEHREAYVPTVHKVFTESGGMLLPAAALFFTGALTAFCFFTALRRSKKAAFTVFGLFSIPVIGMQLWMPSASTDMAGVYFALISIGWLLSAFGANYKKAGGFLCILILTGAALCGGLHAAGGQTLIAGLQDRLESQKEGWIYGGGGENAEDYVLLRVTMSKPQPYYLRGYTGDIYTENGWKPAATVAAAEEKEKGQDNALFYQLSEKNFDSRAMLAEAAEAAVAEIQGTEERNVIQIVNCGASRRYLYLPYESVQIEAKGKGLIGGGILPDKASGSRYAVTAMPYLTDRYGEIMDALAVSGEKGKAYRRAESNYRSYVLKYDTEVPKGCYEAIAAFFPEPKTIQTSGEAKAAILRRLSTLEYDEDVTDSTDKGDFIATFLTRKSGYDKHFAAAAVMGFRYYGIPARLAEGYLITADMTEGVKAGEEIAVTAAQAHCWAEYYEDGVGWLPFETTPPYIGLMKSAGNIDIKKDANTQTEREEKPEKNQNEQQTVTTESEVNYQMLLLLLIILLIVLAAMAWAIYRKLHSRHARHYGRPRRKDTKGANRREAILALMYFIRKREQKQKRNCEKEESLQQGGNRAEIEEIYLEARYSMHEISEEKYQKVLRYYHGLRKKRRAASAGAGVSKLLCVLLVCSLILTGCGEKNSEPYKKAMQNAQDYISATVTEPVSGSIGGEWAVIALTRGGFEVSDAFLDSYIRNTESAVREAKGVLNTATGYKYTEYSRTILGWTAAGKDPADVAGYNLLEKLADMNNVCRQGINGPIWALIAYDCGGYEIPKLSEKDNTTREALLAYLLQEQTADGGWTLSGETADVDLTAMALTAMAPYVCGDEELCSEVSEKTLSEVQAAAEKAVSCLAAKKLPGGGFESWGSENAESCAQVITALSALGVDTEEDERFQGTLSALLTFEQEDGGFAHITDGGTNMMATEQAAYALAAYDRMKNEEARLFDMR